MTSSFRGVDSQTHTVDATHMQRVNSALVCNSSGQFIFLFVLNVFDSNPYRMFNIFNTFFIFTRKRLDATHGESKCCRRRDTHAECKCVAHAEGMVS